jgi:type IV secretion system protein VirB10
VPAGKTEEAGASDASLYVKIQLNGPLKVSALKPGDVVEGKLSRDVYSGDRQLFASGSRVRLTVDKLERRRRVPNDHWPWVVNLFTPRHENYPSFRSASVLMPDGREIALEVSLISIGNEKSVQAPATEAAKPGAKQKAQPTATLEARLATNELLATAAGGELTALQSGPATLAAGTKAKIILLGGVSAGKSRPGDSFQARVVEPVRLDSRILLPEGTLLAGKVVKSTPPRMLSRAGSLLLAFTDVTLPGATGIPASASVTAVELDQRSHTLIDPEGKLRGDRPGKAWMLIHIGVTAGIAKVVDDGTQLVVEAIVETATDASTAGSARIVAICASGLFMLTRHGRDVALPRFTEMNIMFDRPVALPGAQAASHAP